MAIIPKIILFWTLRIGIRYDGEVKDIQQNMIVRRVNFFGEQRAYQLLDLLEFDSDRKCMSVILRCLKTDQLIVFCKGAESSIFERTLHGNKEQCDRDLTRFATFGWRTLALSYKKIRRDEYNHYKQILLSAYNDIRNRQDRLLTTFREIESNLTLTGVSGVEDRLQDDCANTLEELRKTGIKIWVLTGDKRETAINISQSCKHFSSDMIKLQLDILKVLKDSETQSSLAKNE
jgi:phospholipid-translocating ATPase